MLFKRPIPADNGVLRQEIYGGAIFKMAATRCSLEIADLLKEGLAKVFGASLETAHERLPQKEFLAAMKALRSAMEKGDAYKKMVLRLMEECGFSPDENAFDILRLRAVLPNGHSNPELERSYSLHRDTWYANPQSQINWWVALQDTPEERAFSFYPAFFGKKIENTSRNFSFAEWMNKVGWQGARGHQAFDYPRALQAPPQEERRSFSCRAGEILLFSAAQLHQTNPNATSLTRFSFDFRTVHLADHDAGNGAPNADNGSRADALRDYIFPAGRKP